MTDQHKVVYNCGVEEKMIYGFRIFLQIKKKRKVTQVRAKDLKGKMVTSAFAPYRIQSLFAQPQEVPVKKS